MSFDETGARSERMPHFDTLPFVPGRAHIAPIMPAPPKQSTVLDARAFDRTLRRMADEIVELNNGIEGLVIFHDDDVFLNSVEGRTAMLQYSPTRSYGVIHTADVSLHHIVGYGPGAAMNDQDGICRQKCPLSGECDGIG